MATKNDPLIRPNFRMSEIACGCGCGMLPTAKALDALQRMREILGRGVSITSGARCATHNAAVGGASDSRHMKGDAFDIAVRSGRERLEIMDAARQAGFTSFGFAKTFLHIDMRPAAERTSWFY